MERLPNPHKASTRPARERFIRYGATMLSAFALTAVGSFLAGCGSNASPNRSSGSTTTGELTAPGTTSGPKPKPATPNGPKLTIVPRSLKTVGDICSLIPPSEVQVDPAGEVADGCKAYVNTPTEMYGVYSGASGLGGIIDIHLDNDQALWNTDVDKLTNGQGVAVGPVVNGSSTLYLNPGSLETSVGKYRVMVAAGLDTAPKSVHQALDAKILGNVLATAFST